jgi:UDP-N-acetylmuramoyl-L-alanyl-D-glutamate--2,6-diaminopimelate ligase/murE/murF fusion protein
VKLSELLQALSPYDISMPESRTGVETTSSSAETLSAIDITSVHYDSRRMKPGGLFVAIPGFAADGHDYIHEAVNRGAVAVVAQKQVVCAAVTIAVENTRKALAGLAARFYNHPSEKLHITGVTGTNGKTTTAYLIENILIEAGCNVGVIGTVNFRYSGKVFSNPTTTPESLDLQRILAEMVHDGVTHVVMEVSSHAIDLFRIDGCHMNLGVFTNLTQDHLDFHGDLDSYWRCKKKLFTQYLTAGIKGQQAVAVVNIDDERGKELAGDIDYACVTTGRSKQSMVRPQDVCIDLNGIQGNIVIPGERFSFRSPLIGAYNLENILSAAGAGTALHLPTDIIKTGIEKTTVIPGRLENVSNGSGRSVYVDFAHTPDALQNVLQSLKHLDPQRMICIFGCGGDRDKAKRPRMGEIAGALCDLVIVTSDNPRTESPDKIIEQILNGVRRTCPRKYPISDLSRNFIERGHVSEPDRKHAIRLGIDAANPGDIVIIAGKGHETYQIIGMRKIPFDDRREAQKALAGRHRHT